MLDDGMDPDSFIAGEARTLSPDFLMMRLFARPFDRPSPDDSSTGSSGAPGCTPGGDSCDQSTDRPSHRAYGTAYLGLGISNTVIEKAPAEARNDSSSGKVARV